MEPNRTEPALTLREALALPAFAQAHLKVLTGAEQLDKPIKWVHASELSDIHRFLSGGELLLSAGIGIGTSPSEQRAYIRRISSSGAAALVLEEAGRAFSAVPAALVREAEVRGLPVVAVDQEILFAAVSSQVHEELSQRRLRHAEWQLEIEAAFSALLSEGADDHAIVEELSARTNATAVLEDMIRQPTAIAENPVGGASVLDDWAVHSRSAHSSDGDCERVPVTVRGEVWGWLHLVLSSESAMRLNARFALVRAASAVAISMLSERTVRARTDQRSTALVTRLIMGDLSGAGFIAAAKKLGFRFDGEEVVVLVVNSGEEADELQGGASSLLWADLSEYRLCVMPAAAIRASSVVAQIEAASRGGGVSRVVTVDRLPRAVEQAQRAAAVARAKGTARVLSYDELGAERILVMLSEGPELASFVEDELGAVLAWDSRNASPLLPTLRAYLEADGQKSAAAAALFVQRRTLYNRLEKLSRLVGRSLEEPGTRQSLLLAIQGLDLLSKGRRAPR